MTQKAASYAIWKPEHDGHAPPNWREGMKWTRRGMNQPFNEAGQPDWLHGWEYRVSPEALNSPNDDASGDVDTWKRDDATRDMSTCNKCGRRYPSAPVGHIHKCSCSGGMMVRDSVAVKFVANVPSDLSEFSDEQIVRFIQSWGDERKAKHGITLEPPKDWATELFADVLEAWGVTKNNVSRIRNTNPRGYDLAAIELLRTRFEQMKGEG